MRRKLAALLIATVAAIPAGALADPPDNRPPDRGNGNGNGNGHGQSQRQRQQQSQQQSQCIISLAILGDATC